MTVPGNTVLWCSQASLEACGGALCRIHKNLRPGSMRAVQWGAVCSSITLIHSSPLIFRPGSTKCNVGTMSRAPMMPETITPRVVAVCDAVNRSGVSSSSSASIFEVLRDGQILRQVQRGCDLPAGCHFPMAKSCCADRFILVAKILTNTCVMEQIWMWCID